MLNVDLKDQEDRALLQGVPAIAAALLPHIARDPKRIVVVFSTRPRTPEITVLSRELSGELDPEIARAALGAPKMPMVRVVSLRRDGAALCRDVNISDLTDWEETAPT